MGCEELSKNRPWEGEGGRERIIFKIANFVILSISIQNNFRITSVTAYSLAELCLSPEGNLRKQISRMGFN